MSLPPDRPRYLFSHSCQARRLFFAAAVTQRCSISLCVGWMPMSPESYRKALPFRRTPVVTLRGQVAILPSYLLPQSPVRDISPYHVPAILRTTYRLGLVVHWAATVSFAHSGRAHARKKPFLRRICPHILILWWVS